MNINQKIENFNLKVDSISEIENFFSENILKHSRPIMNLWFDKLFRVRNITNENIKDLKTVESIWYPDWNKIPESVYDFNRCSARGQNFFYSSNYLEAAIKEINPKDGDLLLIGLLGMKDKIPVKSQFAGIKRLQKNGRHKLLENYEFLERRDEEIENKISEIFRKRILKENSYEYKLSIAFSNILLKNEEINCLVYPSVASNEDFENYGLKPKFVDDNMYCNEIYIYKVHRTKSKYRLVAEMYGIIDINKEEPKMSAIMWVKNSISHKEVVLVYSI